MEKGTKRICFLPRQGGIRKGFVWGTLALVRGRAAAIVEWVWGVVRGALEHAVDGHAVELAGGGGCDGRFPVG